MAKLGTEFQAIANPAGSRLITLIDETSGLRYKINITDFFALVDSGVKFSGNIEAVDASLTGNITQLKGDAFVDHVMNSNRTAAGVTLGRLRAEWNGTGVAQIGLLSGPNTVDKNEGEIAFFTHNGTSLGERVRIDKDGVSTFTSLAGTGTRNVVVDANGKMSAP